jgi:hypothetical protein
MSKTWRKFETCAKLSLILNLRQLPQIQLNGIVQTKIQRIGNQRVTNRNLIQIRHLLFVIFQIVQIQIMSSVDA